jgi:hypothetical protein
MKHSPVGSSPTKTDTVAKAMDILKDRPLPNPKGDQRQNYGRGSNKPPPKSSKS